MFEEFICERCRIEASCHGYLMVKSYQNISLKTCKLGHCNLEFGVVSF